MPKLNSRSLLSLALVVVLMAAGAVASPFSERHAKHTGTIYPASILAADAAHGDTLLEQVWDMQAAPPSYRTALTPVASYSRPAGTTYTGNAFTVTSTNTISGVDFTGAGVYAINTGTTATLTDVLLQDNPACCFSVVNGQTAAGTPTGNPSMIVSHCLVWPYDANQGHAQQIVASGSGTFSFDHCWFKDTSLDFFGVFAQPLTISWSVFNGMGATQVSGSTAHLEYLHGFGPGDLGTISYTLFDGSNLFTWGGGTAYFQVQSDNGTTTNWTFDHLIIIGNKTAVTHAPNGTISVGLVAWSLKAVNGHDNTITISNSVIQKDLSGRYVVHTEISGQNHIIDGGGNFDYDTGLPINLTLN